MVMILSLRDQEDSSVTVSKEVVMTP